MKTNYLSMTLAGFVLLVSNSVSAEENPDEDFYAGLQYGASDISIKGVSEDFGPGLIMGRFGKFHNDNFALEARLGFGIGSENQPVTGTADRVILDMGSIAGIYGVGHYNFNSKASIYGLVGVSYAEGNTFIQTPTSRSGATNQKSNGASFGIGADVRVWKNVGLNLEYVSYVSNSDFDVRALGIGVVIGY